MFEKLKGLLDLADLAKFAKLKPLASENESSLLDAYIFVNETKIEIDLNEESGSPDETIQDVNKDPEIDLPDSIKREENE